MPPVRAAPARGPHSTNIFPQGSSLGGLQLYPLTGTLPPCWLQGGFIASEAVLCMGGPLLTVGASWIAPAGHGSHSPTMYYTPDQARPPAGGLVQAKPGKNNNSPGW